MKTNANLVLERLFNADESLVDVFYEEGPSLYDSDIRDPNAARKTIRAIIAKASQPEFYPK